MAFRYSLSIRFGKSQSALLLAYARPHAVSCLPSDGGASCSVRRRNHGFSSIDELRRPPAKYGEAHISIYGVMSGMAIMALSLILLG